MSDITSLDQKVEQEAELVALAYLATHIPGYEAGREFRELYNNLKDSSILLNTIVKIEKGEVKWTDIESLRKLTPSMGKALETEKEKYPQTYECINAILEQGIQALKMSYLPSARTLQ